MLPPLSAPRKLGLQNSEHKHDAYQKEKKQIFKAQKPSSKTTSISRKANAHQLPSSQHEMQKRTNRYFVGENKSAHIILPPIKNCESLENLNRYEKRKGTENEGDSSGYSTSTAAFPLHTIPDILSCGMKVLPDMNPAQTIDVNVKIGLKAFNRAQYSHALSCLDRSVLQHPELFLPRFVRGLCNYNLLRLHAAERDFTICCQDHHSYRDDHDQALAFHNRSVIRISLNDTEKAMDDINKAISLDNFENSFYKNRALLYRRSGNFDAAQHDYEMIRRKNETGIQSLKSEIGNLSPHQKKYKRGINTRLDCSKYPHIGKGSPTSKRYRFDSGLTASIYGKVHAGLTSLPHQRTKEQCLLLAKEMPLRDAMFGRLDSDQLLTLWRYLEYHKYPSNVRIFEEGDIADDYSVVWSGSVSARITKKNELIQDANFASALVMEHELIVNTMVAGDALGEASIFDNGARKASCVTEEPSEILTLNRKHFDKTFKVFLAKSHNQKVAYLSRFDFLSNWTSKCFSQLYSITLKKLSFFTSRIACVVPLRSTLVCRGEIGSIVAHV